MSFLSPAEVLDYQTIFQIVATFEGFSIWKGKSAFKTDAFTDIDFSMPIFDDGTFRMACERLKDSKHKTKEIFTIIKVLLKHWMRKQIILCKRFFQSFFWNSTRVLHKSLVFLLRVTPILTIPFLALSYLLQWGCDGTKFCLTTAVLWFIIVKTVCYALCWCFAQMLLRHIRVAVPTTDETNVITPLSEWK